MNPSIDPQSDNTATSPSPSLRLQFSRFTQQAAAKRIEFKTRWDREVREGILALPEPQRVDLDQRRAWHTLSIQRLEKIQELSLFLQSSPVWNETLESKFFYYLAVYNYTYPRAFRINDLPPEILGHIFRQKLASPTYPENSITWLQRLTATCGLWRAIAINDPTLWNDIIVNDAPEFQRSLMYLQRAKDSPLSLHFLENRQHPMTADLAKHVVEKSLIKLPNIRRLVLDTPQPDVLMTFLIGLQALSQQGYAPEILETLVLNHTGQVMNPYFALRPPHLLFHSQPIPTLQHVSLQGLFIDWERSLPLFRNLLTLELRYIVPARCPPLDTFRQYIQASPTLNWLNLTAAGPRWPENNQTLPPPIPIPTLRTLYLGSFHNQYGCFLLHQLSTPNIRTFGLSGMAATGDYTDFFNQLILRGMGSVRILSLAGIHINDTFISCTIAIVKWLRSMPLIAYLRLGPVSTEFLDRLLYDGTTILKHSDFSVVQDVLCPRLKYLELLDGFAPDVVCPWIEQRQKIGSPIQLVYTSAKVFSSLTTIQRNRLRSVVPQIMVLTDGRGPLEAIQLMKE